MRVHYPRTPHLPWSPGAASDDVRVADLSGLRDQEVVVAEKLDGENTTLYADGLHARSLDSGHHPSRAWVKGLQGRIGAAVPAGWRVCGENLYARHSIAYTELDSWFYGFSVWDGDRCLDWDRTVRFLRRLGVPVPRVLWRGTFDERAVRALRALRLDAARQERYVVRTVEGFEREQFGRRVAKWVRRGHVRTDTHWMHASVVENGLSPAAALWAVRSGAVADVPSLVTAVGVDGVHAVAGTVTAGRPGAAAAEARVQVDWSALYAEETGLLGEAPLGPLRAGLRDALAGLGDPDAADRCWTEAWEAYAAGRLATAEEAVAATWRWRSGDFPRLIQLVGPSGSGKSTFAARLPGVDARVSLDDLRQARGSRADQRANADVLREGLRRLDTALAGRATVVWDATSLSRHQRSVVHAVARRRDALITHVVVLVEEDELTRRNADRAHPVPREVLSGQLHRFAPPYPGEAHRTWYVGSGGTVDDTDGTLEERRRDAYQ